MMDLYSQSDSGDDSGKSRGVLNENNNNVGWEKCKDKMMPRLLPPPPREGAAGRGSPAAEVHASRMKAPFHSYTESDGERSKSSTPASSSKDIPAASPPQQQVSHIPANLLFSEEAINLSVHRESDRDDDDDASESADVGKEESAAEREDAEAPPHTSPSEHGGSNVVVIMPEDPAGAASTVESSTYPPRSSMKIFHKKDKCRARHRREDSGGHVVRAPMVPIPVMPEGFFSHHSFLAAQSSNMQQQKRKRKGIPEHVPDLSKKKAREFEDAPVEHSSPKSNIKQEGDAAKKPLPVDPHLAMWSQLWNPYYFMNMAALHNLQQQQGALNGLLPLAAPKSPREPAPHSPAGKPIVGQPPGTPVNLSTRPAQHR